MSKTFLLLGLFFLLFGFALGFFPIMILSQYYLESKNIEALNSLITHIIQWIFPTIIGILILFKLSQNKYKDTFTNVVINVIYKITMGLTLIVYCFAGLIGIVFLLANTIFSYLKNYETPIVVILSLGLLLTAFIFYLIIGFIYEKLEKWKTISI